MAPNGEVLSQAPLEARHSGCSENSINSKSFLLFLWLEKSWNPLFWMVPHLWQRVGLHVFSTLGRGWKRGTALQAPTQTLVFSTPCPVSWHVSLHKHRVPSLLIFLVSQDSCCPGVDMDKLQQKTGGSPTYPGLALEHRMGTFSEDMVQITEFPWNLRSLLRRLELFGKGWPPCTLEWTWNLRAHRCDDIRRGRLTNARGKTPWKCGRDLPRPTSAWVHFPSVRPFMTQIYSRGAHGLVFQTWAPTAT